MTRSTPLNCSCLKGSIVGLLQAMEKEWVPQKTASNVLDATRITHVRFIPTKGLVKDQISSTVPGPGIRPRSSESWSRACVIFILLSTVILKIPLYLKQDVLFHGILFGLFTPEKCVLHTSITSETDSMSF